jgi:tRNA-dihydrouridine synthase B
MISSNALAFQSKRTIKMLEKNPLEDPYSIQLAGSDQSVMQKAVEYINTLEGVSVIDLNCGCPAPKIVNNLQGSSLLTDLPKMAETIRTIKKYSNKEYTSVKIRLGFDEKNHIEIAKICEDNGADFIAVHGRTKAGRYKAAVDYDAIAEIKQAVSIPVIANGDIDSAAKAKWVLEHTGADGIMVGRAAVGKPWIFHQMKEGIEEVSSELIKEVVLEHFDQMLVGKPWIFHQMKEGIEEVSSELIKEVVLEHFDQMLAHYGKYGAIIFRKHLHTYSKAGYEGASAFRNLVNGIEDPSEMRDVVAAFFSQSFIG